MAALIAATAPVHGQALYKYQDDRGEWIYSDRPPVESRPVEVRTLETGDRTPAVTVTSRLVERQVRIVARNDYAIPVEVIIALDELVNLELPSPDQPMRFIVDPLSSQVLLQLAAIENNIAPDIEYRYLWLPGDPRASHVPERPYRVPFAVAARYPVSQTFPVGITHDTPDSWYAVDIAMPIGTGIYAARSGVVFEVASANFQGGTDVERDAQHANIVRIMHDDGSHAVYAHLNWNSIRVRPGDRVERGQYIADSGNTGFTSGPHLHFAVLINRGMRLESVPITFEGADGAAVQPATGEMLTAY